jgi:2-keto-3-deoxy-L-rhamnonate aldolase RhmA
MRKLLLLAVVVFVLPFTLGCAALAKALPQIVELVRDVGDATILIDQVQQHADAFFVKHPDEARQQGVDGALTRARAAAVALERTADGAEALDQKQVAAALADFKAAYEELTKVVEGIDGLHLARPGEALQARPGVLSLPPPLLLQMKVEAGS